MNTDKKVSTLPSSCGISVWDAFFTVKTVKLGCTYSLCTSDMTRVRIFPTVSSFSTFASSETSLASFTVTSSEALTTLAADPHGQCTHVYKPTSKLVCVTVCTVYVQYL